MHECPDINKKKYDGENKQPCGGMSQATCYM